MADIELELSLSGKKALQEADAFAKKVQDTFKKNPVQMEIDFDAGDKILKNRIKLLSDIQKEQDRSLRQQEKSEEQSLKNREAQWQKVARNRIKLVAQIQKQEEKARDDETKKAAEVRATQDRYAQIAAGNFRISELRKVLRSADAEEEWFIGRQIARQKKAAREAGISAQQAIRAQLVASGRAAFEGDINFGHGGVAGLGSRGGTGGPPPLSGLSRAEQMRQQNMQAKRGGRANLLIFQAQQAIEDFSYAGFRGASNNIALIASQLGGNAGLVALAGLAGIALVGMGYAMSGAEAKAKKLADAQARLIKVFIDSTKAVTETRQAIRLGFQDIAEDPLLNMGPKDLLRSKERRQAIGSMIDAGDKKRSVIEGEIAKVFGKDFGTKLIKGDEFALVGRADRREASLQELQKIKPLLEHVPGGAKLFDDVAKLERLRADASAMNKRMRSLKGRTAVDPEDEMGFIGTRKFGAAVSRKLFGGEEEGGMIQQDFSKQITDLRKEMNDLRDATSVTEKEVNAALKEIIAGGAEAARKLAKVASEDVKVFERLKKFLKPETLKAIDEQVALNRKIEESLTGRQIAQIALGELEDKGTRVLEVQLDRMVKLYELERKRAKANELDGLEQKFRAEIAPLVGQIRVIHDFEAMIKEQKAKQLDLVREQISAQKKLISEKDSEIKKNEALIKHTQKLQNESKDRFTRGVFDVQEEQAGAFAKIQNIQQKMALRRSLPPGLAFLGPDQSILKSVLARGDAAIDYRTSIQGEMIRRQFIERRGAYLSAQAATAGKAGQPERQAEILRELQRAQLEEAKRSATQGAFGLFFGQRGRRRPAKGKVGKFGALGRSDAALAAAERTEQQIQQALQGQINTAQGAIQAAQLQKQAAQQQLQAAQSRLKQLQHMDTATIRFMSAVGQFGMAVQRFMAGAPVGFGGPLLPGGINQPNNPFFNADQQLIDIQKNRILQQFGGPAIPALAPGGGGGIFPGAVQQGIDQLFNFGLSALSPNSVINNNQNFVFNGLGGLPVDGVNAAVQAQQRMDFLRSGRQA